MSDFISINHMSGSYRNFLRFVEKQYPLKPAGGFGDVLAQKSAQGAKPDETQNQVVIVTEEMTMEEYRDYIHDRISQIPIHPSQIGWQWNIEITDGGFEAMKADSEYEQYVLHTICMNFSAADPFRSQNCVFLHFGASAEETRAESWNIGGSDTKEKEESFWERRTKRQKKMQEQYEELQKKRFLAKELQKKKYYAWLALHRKDGKGMTPPLPDDAYLARSVAEILEDMSM